MDARDDFDGPTGALATIGAGGIMSAADAAGASLSVPIPFQSKIVLVEDARVAGTTHIHGIDDIVGNLEAGASLRLEREPGNLADSWAIRVYAGESTRDPAARSASLRNDLTLRSSRLFHSASSQSS